MWRFQKVGSNGQYSVFACPHGGCQAEYPNTESLRMHLKQCPFATAVNSDYGPPAKKADQTEALKAENSYLKKKLEELQARYEKSEQTLATFRGYLSTPK
jgi:hypothetical protein